MRKEKKTETKKEKKIEEIFCAVRQMLAADERINKSALNEFF